MNLKPKDILNAISLRVENMRTTQLVLAPYFLGGLILVVLLWVQPDPKSFLAGLLISLAFFMFGIGGVVIAVRHELSFIRGPVAILWGLTIWVGCWSIAVLIWFV